MDKVSNDSLMEIVIRASIKITDLMILVHTHGNKTRGLTRAVLKMG